MDIYNLGKTICKLSFNWYKVLFKKDEVIETKKLYKVILQAYNKMGNVLQDQGKLDEAIVPYNKALSLKPDYAKA